MEECWEKQMESNRHFIQRRTSLKRSALHLIPAVKKVLLVRNVQTQRRLEDTKDTQRVDSQSERTGGGRGAFLKYF